MSSSHSRIQAVTSVTARPRRGTPRAAGRVAQERNERERLWQRYRQSPGDPRAREELLVAYTPLVKYAANRLSRVLPAHLDSDDLVSYGMMGLMGALERYDPRARVKFETFAMTRIRGAIIDELRSLDWVPRSVRRQERVIEDTRRRLEQELSRAPEDEEIAAALEMSEEELRGEMHLVRRGHTLSLEEARTHDDESSPVLDTIADDGASPEAFACESATFDELLEAISHLPDRERLVVQQYWFHGRTLSDIGRELEITESRVSQLNSRAVKRLREYLDVEA